MILFHVPLFIAGDGGFEGGGVEARGNCLRKIKGQGFTGRFVASSPPVAPEFVALPQKLRREVANNVTDIGICEGVHLLVQVKHVLEGGEMGDLDALVGVVLVVLELDIKLVIFHGDVCEGVGVWIFYTKCVAKSG